MKLLVITASYPPHQVGGYEIRCKDVMDGLAGRGHDLLILTSRCADKRCEIHPGSGNIERVLHTKLVPPNIGRQLFNDWVDIRYIHRKVKEYKPDIVYLWGIQNLSNTILPYLSDKNVRVVYDEGGSGSSYLVKIQQRGNYFYRNRNDPFIKKLLKGIFNSWVRFASRGLIRPEWSWPKDMRLYFNSHSSLNYAREHRVPVENASVIYSGLEIVRFPFASRAQLCNPIQIILPGRIKPEKGTKDGILLVKELRKRNIEVRLKIIGKVQSGDYHQELKALIEVNGLTNVIEILPMVPIDDLFEQYQKSDICFFPSYFKTGMSRVPLEAMASGCVVFSYGNEGSEEIIRNRETGFIVSEGDISAAVDAMEAMLKDPAKYRGISLRARLKIETEHSFDRYVDSIEAYLHESIQKRSAFEAK